MMLLNYRLTRRDMRPAAAAENEFLPVRHTRTFWLECSVLAIHFSHLPPTVM